MEEDAYKKWIENFNNKLPFQNMMLCILENNYNIQILKQYLSPMLNIDFPIDAIRDEIEFFLKKNVDSIVDSWFGKNLTSKYNEIEEVEDHLSIILAYREANKEITPSVIEKSINKPSYLTTILVLDKRIDSKLFKDVDKKILNIQKYDEIIHILSYIDRLQDEPVINYIKETFENNIKQLETKSKNLKEFQIDRENIIEEIIKDINFIINKYHKHNKSNNNKTNQPSVEKIYSTTIDIKEREKGEKKEYYKLFDDLSSEEWGKIFNTFMELTNATTLGENISVKKNKIKAYCDENKYDFLTALREIYFYIRGSYSCRWFNTETKERGRDYFDKEKLRVHKEFFPEIFIYNDTPESNRSMVEEEEQDIYYTMINILKERKENPEEYVNNALQKVRLKADSLSFFEKEFHIKASLIENNKENKSLKGEKLYIELAEKLTPIQQDDIFKIWIDNLERDTYHKNEKKAHYNDIKNRVEAITQYCIKEHCDLVRALQSIYNRIKNKYLCCFYDKTDKYIFKKHKYIDYKEIDVFVVDNLNQVINNDREKVIIIDTIKNVLNKDDALDVKDNDIDLFNRLNIDFISLIDTNREKNILDLKISFSLINRAKELKEKKDIHNKPLFNIENISSLDRLEQCFYVSFQEVFQNNTGEQDDYNDIEDSYEVEIKMIKSEIENPDDKSNPNSIVSFYLPNEINTNQVQQFLLDNTNQEELKIIPKDNIKQKKELPKVEIDVKAFKEYFKLDFTKEGDGSNFDKLINDMRGSLNGYNKKDIVALAYIIRKSEKIHHAKYSGTFNKWLREFCALINHEVPTIKANQVKNNIEKLKVTYYYL